MCLAQGTHIQKADKRELFLSSIYFFITHSRQASLPKNLLLFCATVSSCHNTQLQRQMHLISVGALACKKLQLGGSSGSHSQLRATNTIERGGKSYRTAGHIGGSKVSGELYLNVVQGLLCVLLHPLNFPLHVHQLPLSQLTFLLHRQACEIPC